MKLKFMDKVKILSGFYEGLEGNLMEQDSAKEDFYLVEGFLNTSRFMCKELSIWIDKINLEKLED